MAFVTVCYDNTYTRDLLLISTLSLFIGTANSTLDYVQISKYAHSSIGFKVSSFHFLLFNYLDSNYQKREGSA